MNEILRFIKSRFNIDCNWTTGNCYYFALILKDRFSGKIFYDVINGHFLTLIGSEYYDFTGKVNIEDKVLIEWDNFDEYDLEQKKRIIRDCLN